MNKRLVTISKFLAKYLRHTPNAIGLTLEPNGWVLIDDLLAAASNKGFRFTRAELEQVVAENDKKRYSFDETGTKIRANQGHSADVELQFPVATPPAVLYQGTALHNLESIFRTGLNKGNRHHVHMTTDLTTARSVGKRHGAPVILRVDAARMVADGHTFWLSENGVWLAEHVPSEYLEVLPEESNP